MGKHLFTAYHMYKKDKLVGNQTWNFVYTISYLYFGYSFDRLENLSTVFFFACNNGTCTIELGLVTKKGKLPRVVIHLFLHPLKTLSFILNLTILKCA